MSVKPLPRHLTPDAHNGAVLLMALLVTGMLALASLSFSSSVSGQIGVARNEASSLHSELAAQSALEYARRRLLLDPTWAGTGIQAIQLSDGTSFTVEREVGDVSNINPTEVSLTLEGSQYGKAFTRLQTTVEVQPGDPVRDKALSILGGRASGSNITVEGDILWVDAPGYLRDYRKGRNWVAAPFVPALIQFSRLNLFGKLWKCSNKIYGTPGRERKVDKEIHAPGWDMKSWLEPGKDRRIYKNIRQLKNLHLKQTAVVILKPGAELHLENVQLLGGLVVFLESDALSHAKPRNKIILKGKCIIGKGENYLGILAPGCRLRTDNGKHKIFGVNLLHSIARMRRSLCDGLTVVLNDAQDIRDSTFRWDSNAAENPPEGIEFFGELPSVNMASLHEVYE